MKIRKIISAILTMSVMSACIIPIAKADGLYSEKFDMTKVKADKTDGVTKEVEVPDGDYTVTVTTGGKTETNANIYINCGERVRAYTLEAGETQENEQPVVPKNGKITVQVKGDNPNVTENLLYILQVIQRHKLTTIQRYTLKQVGDKFLPIILMTI